MDSGNKYIKRRESLRVVQMGPAVLNKTSIHIKDRPLPGYWLESYQATSVQAIEKIDGRLLNQANEDHVARRK